MKGKAVCYIEMSSYATTGRDSPVGVATRFGLDASGVRIPVGTRFSTPVQTGPGAHPASYTTGIGSFPGVKRPGRGADHPPPSKCRGHERVGLYLYSPSGFQWPFIGRTLPLPFSVTQLFILKERKPHLHYSLIQGVSRL